LPPFVWNESEGELKKTALNQTHRDLGGIMVPFAGWEMPVQYTGIFEEHLATRNAAGLFDVSHMGVYDVRGADAASFLDTVCGNDCGGLLPGESLYSHFLTPDADVILEQREVTVVPDIVANAGGVTVSYFEWVQDLQSFFWDEGEINARLEKVMKRAFQETWEKAHARHVSLRHGAYFQAIERVAEATMDRGIYP
jgi:hypothetical protein